MNFNFKIRYKLKVLNGIKNFNFLNFAKIQTKNIFL